MLEITIDPGEVFNSETQEFITVKPRTIQMEHSLVAIAKWESKWHKAFLTKKPKSIDEMLDYFRCMTITQNVDPMIYKFMSQDNIDSINEYIHDTMTATSISKIHKQNSGPKDTMTSEVIYYYMIALQIPVEFQKWHINRLLTLIDVCSIKNNPPKKMSQSELMSRNKALNASRCQKLGTKG